MTQASLFTRASDIQKTDTLLASIWGKAKSGKTTLTVGNERLGIRPWPAPILFFNFDQGVTELIPQMAPEARRELFVVDLASDDPFMSEAGYRKLLSSTEQAIKEAIQHVRSTGYGTIVVDTMSQLWTLIQKVDFDVIKQRKEAEHRTLTRLDYGDANARYRALVSGMRASGGNVVLLHHAQEVFGPKGEALGVFKAKQHPDTEGAVQVQLRAYSEDQPVKGGIKTTYGAELQSSRHNAAVRGMTLPKMDYPTLYQAIFGDDEEDAG